MKLLTKYNRINLLATFIVFAIAGLCYYFILQHILIGQLDDDLKIEEQEIIDYVRQNNKLPEVSEYPDQQIVFEKILLPVDRKLQSITINDKEENGGLVKTRRLEFSIKDSGTVYKVSVYKSQQETEDMVQLIVLITLGMVLLLLLILFAINRFVLDKLWHPFNNTLSELKRFNVSGKSAISVKETNINEFNELNNAVFAMSNNVLREYEALKSFTENASHEIQTPLAIINLKLELLMQAENFTEIQMKDFETIRGEISRLSKLNKSLLLLTKIDNNQFQQTCNLEIGKVIVNQIENFEELIASKDITLTQNVDTAFTVEMNEIMGGILISNLLTNSIKHNTQKGTIDIRLHDKLLSIQNSGAILQSAPDDLFERFKKESAHSESLGLGLSIVKKICDQYDFRVSYSYRNGLHAITVQF